ncbi:MAG: gfo/Idh/MocA family oxidoreductase, partial [Gemmataceae bacterium]
MTEQNRRSFFATSAVAGTAMAMTAKSYAAVTGANENLRIGFLGVGGRCQQHIDVILKMQEEKKGVTPVAANDVWDGDQTKGKGKGQGLFPSAKRMGVNVDDKDHVAKDYRKILEQKDV